MCKDSLVRRSKLKLSYPSIQYSESMSNFHNNPWWRLFRDSLPFQVSTYENI